MLVASCLIRVQRGEDGRLFGFYNGLGGLGVVPRNRPVRGNRAINIDWAESLRGISRRFSLLGAGLLTLFTTSSVSMVSRSTVADRIIQPKVNPIAIDTAELMRMVFN